ncbi:MAG: hypothetical protein ACK5L3_13110 [Oscillospiraceae bacterium]
MAAKRNNGTAFVPHLCIFGLYVFLLLWEAAPHYLLNQYLNQYGMFAVAPAFTAGRLLASGAKGG